MLEGRRLFSYHIASFDSIISSFVESFNDRIIERKQITSLDLSDVDSLYEDSHRNHFDVFIWKPINCFGTVILSNNDDNFWTFLVKNSLSWKIIDIRDLESIREFIILQDAKWIRVVRVMKEAHWVFFEYGTPLPFEKKESYTKRVNKNRLTSELISLYCKESGCNIISEDFFKCDKVGYYYRVAKETAKTNELIHIENNKYVLEEGIRQSLDSIIDWGADSISFNYQDKRLSIIDND